MRKVRRVWRWIVYWTTPNVILYRVFNRIPKRNTIEFLEDQRRRAERKKPALFFIEKYWFSPW